MDVTDPVALDASRTGLRRFARTHPLAPVMHRYRWIGVGVAVQAAGVAVLVAWAYSKYKRDATLGLAAKSTVMLVWEQTVHSRAGLAVCAAAALVFAVGCVIAARPFARTRELLVVVVPLAAVAGVVVLGALVVVVIIGYFVLVVADGPWGGGGGSSGGAKKKKTSGADRAV